ncbi:MAG: hypothetical protein A3D94_00290 [Alphaproteobacteria bacterium RIFCSPHIGHO2_12_FULL_66_14]|nr:MAG: hypothetical protein A3D94_00290 [Alphaproteobacteria bacterium RIFCSPHIGHO2_12_FULL_66_14]
MTDVDLLAVAAAVLGAGGLLIFVYLRIESRQAATLTERVVRAVGVRSAKPLATPVHRSIWREEANRLARLPFMFGIERTWGVTYATWHLAIFALGTGALTWLLLRGLLHLPLWLAAIGTLAALVSLPRFLMIQQQRSADARFLEAFPDALDMCVRMVRSGLPVVAAMRTVGQQASPPVNVTFAHVADLCEIGVPLETALSNISTEIGLPDFHFFAIALGLQRRTGGNLARTLETFAEIIRKRRAVRMKATSTTAEVRMSAIILTGIPFFVIGTLAIINPGYLDPLINDPRGNVVLGAALLGLILGGLSMRWMIRSTTLV